MLTIVHRPLSYDIVNKGSESNVTFYTKDFYDECDIRTIFSYNAM